MDCRNCGKQQRDDARFCSECGFDLRGSQGPAGAPAGKKKMSGCMLAALIGCGLAAVSIPIIGIIAAIAIPNFLNAVDRGKQKRTMADIRTIATTIEEYSIDHETYPPAASIEELQGLLGSEYGTLPTMDGWGRPFRVESRTDGYLLVSPGKNGTYEGCPGGVQVTFDADICFENGDFTQWPEGRQL